MSTSTAPGWACRNSSAIQVSTNWLKGRLEYEFSVPGDAALLRVETE